MMTTLKFHTTGLRVLSTSTVKLTSSRLFSTDPVEIQNYENIPKSPKVPILGSFPYFLRSGGPKQLHNYINDLHKTLGPIFVDKIIGSELVFVSDPEASIKIFREEGQYPQHFVPEPWTLYLEETGEERGLFFMDGPEWQKNRQILNNILPRIAHLETQVGQLSQVTKDFVASWEKNPPTGDNLENNLYRWNIECLGAVAFGTRLGFLDKLYSDKLSLSIKSQDDFVNAVHNVFKETSALSSMPAQLAKQLNVGPWKRFYSAVSFALSQGRTYVKQGLEVCSKPNPHENIINSLLYKLAIQERVDLNSSTKLIVDLIFASADTTSHVAVWALYLLGKNPVAVQKAKKEMSDVFTKDEKITYKILNSLPYLRGLIKEVLRLYPTAPFLTRRLNKDINILGYSIPAGKMLIISTYTMARDPQNFGDPDSFIPERWIRNKNRDEDSASQMTPNRRNHNQKAYLPFGLGARACIGKRIAEIELSLLIIEALQSYNWEIEKDVDMVLRMIPVPSEKFDLNLKKI